jgi:ABC-2 type transport system ATP-binding protein
MDLMIEARGIRKRFGSTIALAGVDVTAPTGKVLGLLGPNGAGKTTLVRILTTLLAADSGSASVAGYDVVRDASRLRSVIGLAGQYAAVDENLTGRENLKLVAQLYHLPRPLRDERTQEVLELFELVDAADRLVRTYSGGMRRRLDLGASLVARPPVVILDEPTAGLDPRSRVELWQTIKTMVADGTTVLLTTQYLEEADRLADKIVVIDQGQVIAEGTVDELKSRLGGDRIELTVADPSRFAQASELVSSLTGCAATGAGPSLDATQRRISVPTRDRTRALTAVMRGLDGAGIELDDISLRRPSLDEVFLALTGHAASIPEVDQPKARRRTQLPGRSRR